MRRWRAQLERRPARGEERTASPVSRSAQGGHSLARGFHGGAGFLSGPVDPREPHWTVSLSAVSPLAPFIVLPRLVLTRIFEK